jgi:hypothetical protein
MFLITKFYWVFYVGQTIKKNLVWIQTDNYFNFKNST